MVNVQTNQRIDTMESSLNQKLNGLQSELDQKIDILQYSISRLTNQHDHQEEENLEEKCLIDTILGEQAQLQLQKEVKEEPTEGPEELQDAPQLCVVYGPWRRKEEIHPLISEEGSGKEAGKEPQNPIAQATNSPLPCPDPVHILPTPAAHGTPTAKAIPSALPVHYFRKLVAYVQTFSTTSKKLAAAHVAWHSGWLIPKPSWLRFGAPKP